MPNDQWPPRFVITPEGIANLFLITHCPNCGTDARDKLVEILKLYWQDGYDTGLKDSKDPNHG